MTAERDQLIAAHDASRADKIAAIDEKTQQCADAFAKLEVVVAERDAAREHVSEVETRLGAADVRTDELKQAVSVADERAVTAAAAHCDLMAKLEELSAERDALAEQRAAVEVAHSEMEHRCATAVADALELRARIDAMGQCVRGCTTEVGVNTSAEPLRVDEAEYILDLCPPAHGAGSASSSTPSTPSGSGCTCRASTPARSPCPRTRPLRAS